MAQIKLTDVWKNLVSYYYAHVQTDALDVSIWDFVEKEYHGTRTFRLGLEQHQIRFDFKDDADATAFKLKFLDTDCT